MDKTELSQEATSTPIKSHSTKNLILQLAALADVKINGHRPWDIQVHNEKFYNAVFYHGTLGLGESYMDKWWDCQALDVLFDKFLRAKLEDKIKIPLNAKMKYLLAGILNFQTKRRSKQVAIEHYDLGNDLFTRMLDKNLMYSCGYWKEVDTLDAAQIAKLDLICRKLRLEKGQRLLDIGCGWGGLAKYAAENYGVEVTGVTISQQQFDYATQLCQSLPVTIKIQDYRDIKEKYDRIVSVGMFEHVGYLNYAQFMQTTHNALTDQGIFLLHTIGNNQTSLYGDEWITKYIFPNSTLPSISWVGKAIEGLFVMEDWQNFGAYYDQTLMAWYKNFTTHWDEIKSAYGERFYRMWTYYLLQCAATFRSRRNQLWQIVLSKNGLDGVYMSPR